MDKKILSALMLLLLILQIGFNTSVSAAGLYDNKVSIVENEVLCDKNINPLNEKIKKFESIMDDCVNKNYVFKEKEIDKICDKAVNCLNDEASLLKINGSAIIVGDIHGDIKALNFCIKKFLREVQTGKSILFLGDYVDRGKNGVECAALVLKLKTMFPDKVFLLRGNHEMNSTNYKYGFFREVLNKYNSKHVYKKINGTFNYLSIAAIVNDSLFCVHGGISPKLNDLDILTELKKPMSYESLNEKGNRKIKSLVMDLLWSDPDEVNDFEKNVKRGRGTLFGSEQVNEFLSKFNLNCIIRGHQCVDGYDDKFEDGRLITIFSVPKYVGKSNKGAIVDYIDDSDISIVEIVY